MNSKIKGCKVSIIWIFPTCASVTVMMTSWIICERPSCKDWHPVPLQKISIQIYLHATLASQGTRPIEAKSCEIPVNRKILRVADQIDFGSLLDRWDMSDDGSRANGADEGTCAESGRSNDVVYMDSHLRRVGIQNWRRVCVYTWSASGDGNDAVPSALELRRDGDMMSYIHPHQSSVEMEPWCRIFVRIRAA